MSTSAAADGKQRSNSAAHTRTHAYQQHRHKHTRHLQQHNKTRRLKPGYKQHIRISHTITNGTFTPQTQAAHKHNCKLQHKKNTRSLPQYFTAAPQCRHNTLLKSHGAECIFYCCLILSVEKLHPSCCSDKMGSRESSTLARWRKKPNKKYQQSAKKKSYENSSKSILSTPGKELIKWSSLLSGLAIPRYRATEPSP